MSVEDTLRGCSSHNLHLLSPHTWERLHFLPGRQFCTHPQTWRPPHISKFMVLYTIQTLSSRDLWECLSNMARSVGIMFEDRASLQGEALFLEVSSPCTCTELSRERVGRHWEPSRGESQLLTLPFQELPRASEGLVQGGLQTVYSQVERVPAPTPRGRTCLSLP